jgi:hypothetical protein
VDVAREEATDEACAGEAMLELGPMDARTEGLTEASDDQNTRTTICHRGRALVMEDGFVVVVVI